MAFTGSPPEEDMGMGVIRTPMSDRDLFCPNTKVASHLAHHVAHKAMKIFQARSTLWRDHNSKVAWVFGAGFRKLPVP